MVEGYIQPENNSPVQSDDEIMTMAELLDQEDDDFLPVLKAGQIVEGVVVRKNPQEILVDIGAKSEGIVDARDLENLTPEEIAEIRVGEKIPVYVVRVDSGEDYVNLSLSQARIVRDWNDAARLYEAGETVESTVIGSNKGGLIVGFGQIRGFVPGSQLLNAQAGGAHRPGRWGQMTGETLQLKIIEVDRDRNRLILSERAVADEMRQERVKILEELQEGTVVTGYVTRLVNFGAFIDIGGVEGLAHLSELAWTRISHPREVLKAGEEVEVYILNVDVEQQRIALSLKRLQPEPWSEVFEHYQINQIVEAVITKLTDFGAFARLDDRIEGLIHISEITDRNITHPRDVLSEGQQVEVRIIHIDPERRRMGLSLKQAEGHEDWADYQEDSAEDVDGAE